MEARAEVERASISVSGLVLGEEDIVAMLVYFRGRKVKVDRYGRVGEGKSMRVRVTSLGAENRRLCLMDCT